jgi:hypothetical protein
MHVLLETPRCYSDDFDGQMGGLRLYGLQFLDEISLYTVAYVGLINIRQSRPTRGRGLQ